MSDEEGDWMGIIAKGESGGVDARVEFEPDEQEINEHGDGVVHLRLIGDDCELDVMMEQGRLDRLLEDLEDAELWKYGTTDE